MMSYLSALSQPRIHIIVINVLLLVLSGEVCAGTHYVDENFQKTSQAKAYFRYDDPVKQPNGTWLFTVFYAEKNQQARVFYADGFDAQTASYQGKYVAWYRDGSLDTRTTCYHDAATKKDSCPDGLYENWKGRWGSEAKFVINGVAEGWDLDFNALPKPGASSPPVCQHSITADKLKDQHYRPEPGCIDPANQRGFLRKATWYEHDKRNGVQYDYNSQGQVTGLATYLKGKRNGLSRDYYDSGTLRRERHYRHGNLHGEDKYYDKQGTLTELKTYKNGELDGVVKRWAHHQLMEARHFKHGLKNGKDVQYYSNGQMKSTQSWLQNQPVGTAAFFAENGQVTHRIQYNDRHRMVEEKTWRDDGQLKSEKVFIKTSYGMAYKTTEYTSQYIKQQWNTIITNHWFKEQLVDRHTNKIVSLEERVDEQRVNDFLRLKNNGEILIKGRYRHGYKVGDWLDNQGGKQAFYKYDQQGHYHGEQRVSYDNGDLEITQYVHGKKQGRYELTNASHRVKAQGHYQADLKTGDWIDIENCLRDVSVCHGHYKKGKRVGQWHSFDKYGFLIYLLNFDQQGLLQGKNYQFNEYGMVDAIFRFRDDKKEGKQTFYRADGTIDHIEQYQAGKLVKDPR